MDLKLQIEKYGEKWAPRRAAVIRDYKKAVNSAFSTLIYRRWPIERISSASCLASV